MAPAEQYGYRLLPSDEPPASVDAPAASPGGGPPALAGPAAAARGGGVPEPPAGGGQPGSLVRGVAGYGENYMPTRHVHYDGGVRFDLSKDPWVVHPHIPVVQLWNAAISALLLVDVVYLPLEMAFGRSLPRAFVVWFNGLSTFLFSLDICLQFFLQVPSPTGDYWIFNHKKIIHTYLTGFFLVDLLGVIPFCQFYEMGSLHNEQRLYVAQLLQFLRFLRMLRFRHIIMKYQYDFDLSYLRRAVLYNGLKMLLSVHVMGCVWATLGNYQDGQSWRLQLRMKKSRGKGPDLYDVLNSDAEDPVVMYITSAYFALYTLTGIGYGDIGPTTSVEYFLIIGMMLLGSLVWATIIGEIVGVIQHANMDETHHQEKMDTVLEMSKEFGLSNDLRMRLQEYFRQLRSTRRTTHLQMIMARMNSELAISFVLVIHGRWLGKIWWLKDVLGTPFIVQLSLATRPVLYCPKEYIAATDRLHIIQQGLCIHGRQVLSKDSCWGVDMLLSQEHLRQFLVTLAISYLHLLYLTREALEATLDRFPLEREKVRRAYRVLCLMRGFAWRARSMKAKEAMAQCAPSRLQGSASQLSLEPEVRVRGVSSGMRYSSEASDGTQCHEDDFLEIQHRLGQLEAEMDRRLSAVEARVSQALELLSGALEAKQQQQQQQRKGWGGRVPGRRPG